MEIDWKAREVASTLRVPPDLPVIVRVDGWGFQRLAEELNLTRPYDRRLAEALVYAAKGVLEGDLGAKLAYCFSDEISFIFRPPLPFSGRIEKLGSLTASVAAVRVSRYLSEALDRDVEAVFDGRVVLIAPGEERLYLAWRQAEALRNHLNSYALYALERGKGLTRREAAEHLKGLKSEQLRRVIVKYLGIEPESTPEWQRLGILLYFRRVQLWSYNPVTGERTSYTRRRLVEDWSPPIFKSLSSSEFLKRLLD